MISVDTNILIRLFVDDLNENKEQMQAARKLVATNEKIFIAQAVQLEFIWVLTKAYKVSKDNILSLLNELLENKAFILQREDHFETATKFFKNSSVGFSDCLILSESNNNNSNYLYTFDKKLAKLHGAKELKY